jgi:L-iditol 2-dehydrogenase
LDEVDTPAPMSGEVLVRVKCAGICSSDVSRVFGTGAYHYPIIPGHEFSGVVEKAYSDDEVAWLGKRVGVYPLIPNFEDTSVKDGAYETSSDYGYLGSRQDGGYAEYVAVPVWNLIELPDKVTFEESAMLEPSSVAFHAVKRIDFAHIRKSAVIGNGTIGKLTARWLSIYGVPEINLMGRDDTLKDEMDVCFECVGTADSLKRCIVSAKPNGQIVIVGNPPADFKLEQKLYWQILRKQLVVRGTWNSRFPDDWRKSIDAVSAGRLNPAELISHRFDFKDLDKAFALLRDKTEKAVKVMVGLPGRV